MVRKSKKSLAMKASWRKRKAQKGNKSGLKQFVVDKVAEPTRLEIGDTVTFGSGSGAATPSNRDWESLRKFDYIAEALDAVRPNLARESRAHEMVDVAMTYVRDLRNKFDKDV